MAGSDSTLAAYKAARERAACARDVEDGLLRMAIMDAQEAGLSVRETAALVGVPKSTVSRHRLGWRREVAESTRRDGRLPAQWVTEQGFVEAHNAAWAHEPSEQIERAPFLVTDLPDGSREWTMLPSPTLRPLQPRPHASQGDSGS